MKRLVFVDLRKAQMRESGEQNFGVPSTQSFTCNIQYLLWMIVYLFSVYLHKDFVESFFVVFCWLLNFTLVAPGLKLAAFPKNNVPDKDLKS